MNINEQLNQGQKEAGISTTGYFKFTKGQNRIRILTAGEVVATHFFGKGKRAATCYGMEKGCPFHGENAPKNDKGQEAKPSIKYTCYVSKEDVVELADLPYSVMKQVGDLQENVDYQFSSFPMPYDITVKFDPDSKSPNDMYKVIPSPNRLMVPQEVIKQLDERMTRLTPSDSVAKKKAWQISEHDKDGTTAKRKEAFKASVAATPTQEVDSIEYPEDEIKPEDIPF